MTAHRRASDLPSELAALAGTWRTDDDPPLQRRTLRVGGATHAFLANTETSALIARALQELPALVARLERERDTLTAEVDRLQEQLDALRRRPSAATTATPAPAPASRPTASTSLADVPLAMIGTFAVSPKVKAAAKKDPLLALVVQIDQAMAADASELDRARLLAMAAAVARGDLGAFWAATGERSKKKLAATRDA